MIGSEAEAMIERVCGMCGSAWGKSYKFCPADGAVLVAVDSIVARMPEFAAMRPVRQKKSSNGRTEPELEAVSEVDRARKPSPTRGFGATDTSQMAPTEWVNPVFTNKKSHEAAAFVETACHQRPSILVEALAGRSATEALHVPAIENGPKTSPTQRSRFGLRVGGDLVQ